MMRRVGQAHIRPHKRLSVLLVEDDLRLADLMSEYLAHHQIDVYCEARGDWACQRAAETPLDLVVLDLMLPGCDGFAVCRRLRSNDPSLPIIMLTASDDAMDQVLGLEVGADNYLQKPIEPQVLLAHIRALMRRVEMRATPANENGSRAFGRLRIELGARLVTLGDTRIDLSAAEFDLLWLFACNAGRVMSRDEILQQVRNLEYDGMNRSVDYRVFRLRKKLGDVDGAQERIKTVRGAGYLFATGAW